MEMENSAVTQLMATQTTILEEIRRLREKDELRQRFAEITNTPAGAAPMGPAAPSPESQISMYQGEDYHQTMSTPPMTGAYDGNDHYNTLSIDPYNSGVPGPVQNTGMSTPPMPPIAPVDPSKYANASAPVAVGMMGATTAAASTMLNYDPSRMSKEATAEYFAQRSQGVQMGAVDAAGKALQVGGFLGSFAVGGLLPSLAVGGAVAGATAITAGAMVNGAQDALQYQDILRRDGYKAFNAFESTTEYGGIGMNLDDQQDVSGYMRDLANDSYLDTDEMSGILQGSLDNKLLKSVKDVKEFKEKFSKIVEGVKEISLTLDKTLDESIEFMGEMERRGVMTEKMGSVAAQFKVGASMLGIDADQFTQQALQQTDQIVSGTSMDAENVMEGVSYDAYLMSAIEENSAAGDGTLKQYIKNSGGSMAMAGEMENATRGYLQEGMGSKYALAIAAPAFEQNEDGSFALNETKFNEILESDASFIDLQTESNAYINSLSSTDQARLVETAGSVINQTAESDDVYKILERQMEAFMNEAGEEMDSSTALMKMGIVGNYEQADILAQMIDLGTDDATQNQFDARALKEEMDSAEKARNPGIMKELEYGGKKLLAPLGDGGQWVSDSVGDIGEDIQMFTAGIEENGIVGGELLPDYNSETLDTLYVGEDSVYSDMIRNIEEMKAEANPNAPSSTAEAIDNQVKMKAPEAMEEIASEFSTNDYERMVAEIDDGSLASEDLLRLRESVESGKLDGASQERADYVLGKASGDYEGVMGKAAEFWDYSKASSEWNGDSWGLKFGSMEQNSDIGITGTTTLEDIEGLEEVLKEDMTSAQEELQALMASGDVGVGAEKGRELEVAIRSGDVEAVTALGASGDSVKLAETFQGLVGRNEELAGSKSQYTEFTRYAAASGEYAGNIMNFLETTGAFEEGEINDLYAEYEKEAKNLSKSVEDGDLSGDQLYQAQVKLNQKGEDVFAYMGSEEIYKVATDLAEKNDAIDMNDLLVEGSEYTVDPAKLYESLMNDVMKPQQASESEAEKSLGADEIKDTAANHEEALMAFANTMVNETKTLREIVADIEDGNIKNNYTSAGTK